MFGLIRSGMVTAMKELQVVSNNIANSGSTAFRKSDISFSDIYSQTTAGADGGSQFGSGVRVAAVRMSEAQGGMVQREGALNLAIAGSGYFVLSPTNTPEAAVTAQNFTRNGEFSLDSQGYLRATNNSYVLGTKLNSGEGADTEADTEGAAALSKIQVPQSIGEETKSALTDISVTSDGTVTATYGIDTIQKLFTLSLANFPNQAALGNLGGSTFVKTDASGEPIIASSGSSGLGSISSGMLETSNVDITNEMTAMIRSQQQFNGAARLLQTNADMIEKLTR
ncbi:flagellar hook basal-body protein [Planktomarina temperata]|nr:flagellar hook basal-body protein [Planktomarina temperata]